LELPDITVQMTLPNTKYAMEIQFLLKQPFALQAQVAIPYLMLTG